MQNNTIAAPEPIPAHALQLISELKQQLVAAHDFIVNKEANDGQAVSQAKWRENVRRFTETTAEVSVGRSHVPEASVNLFACREAIAKAESALKQCQQPR